MTSVKVELRHPIQWGKDETISDLEIKPNGRMFRDLELPGAGTGFKPYAFAVVGAKCAGRTAPEAFVDKMHPTDQRRVAEVVLGFYVEDVPTTGS
jgi:hypothetical protein